MIKTDHLGYVKSDARGFAPAILNIDTAAFNAYKDKRAKELALSQVIQDVDNMKQDISDIKNLLIKLVDGNK